MSIVLAILEGEDAGREFVFDRLPILIGRTEACNVVLYHPSISRQHCRFYQEGNRIFIEDLRSINGTFVNGVPVLLNSVLDPGDIVGLGSLSFRFDTLELSEPMEPSKLPGKGEWHKGTPGGMQKQEAQEEPVQSEPTQEEPVWSELAQEEPVWSEPAQKEPVHSNGTSELPTLDRLFAFKPIPKSASLFPQKEASSLEDKSLSEGMLAKQSLAAQKPTQQSVAQENVFGEILPEEIEEILPDELFSKENLFEEGVVEEKFPEELLAEETLARENRGRRSFFEDKPNGQLGAILEEEVLRPEALAAEVEPSMVPENAREPRLLDEPQWLEQISVEQTLLAEQKLKPEIFAEAKLPEHTLVRGKAVGSFGLQRYMEKTASCILKHPILFTSLGCLLGVLVVLFFSR